MDSSRTAKSTKFFNAKVQCYMVNSSATHCNILHTEYETVIGYYVSTAHVSLSNLVEQIHCTFPMGKPIIVCNDNVFLL